MNENYFNDIEKEKLVAFFQDKEMVKAVRKGILVGTYRNGVPQAGEEFESMRNWAIHILRDGDQKSNEQAGAELRAHVEALNFVEAGFQKLEEFSKPKVEVKKKTNPAV